MVIDVFTFNGELDILSIRLNVLSRHVDKFVICEFTETFSGLPKILYYDKYRYLFRRWRKKIEYHVFRPTDWEKYMEMALKSPNTKGADHWKQEFCQKECLKDAIKNCQNDDFCFIGDVDEIWDYRQTFYRPERIRLKVYTYYLNNRSNEIFNGTLCADYSQIKDSCLNHMRSNPFYVGHTEKGWHFTSLAYQLRKKLIDSYTKETYANNVVMSNLDENIKKSRDFLGRDFVYKLDESDWPAYLKKYKEKYTHLLKI